RLLNIEHPEVVRCVAWTRNLIATGCAESKPMNRLWNADSGEQVYETKADGFGTLAQACTSERSLLASGGYSHTVRVITTPNRRPLCKLISAGQVWALAFHPDGRYVTAGQSGRLQLWDTEFYHENTFPIRTREVAGVVRGIAFTADGRHLVTATKEPNEV